MNHKKVLLPGKKDVPIRAFGFGASSIGPTIQRRSATTPAARRPDINTMAANRFIHYEFFVTFTNMAVEPKFNIVILGASYAGISTAHYLLKHGIPNLANPSDYCITMVSPSDEVLCRPACPRAMISETAFDQRKLFVKVKDCFKGYPDGFWDFLMGEVTRVDTATRLVHVRDGEGPATIGYHALVIATGASTPSPLLGLNGNAEDLREKWAELRRALPDAKNIVIAGGGPAGVETAAELTEHINSRHQEEGCPKPQIHIITSSPQLLPHLRHSIAAQAEKQLVKMGIRVLKETRVVHTSSGLAPTRCHLSNGEDIEADIYIPAVGTVPNTGFLDRIGFLSSDDRIITDAHLRVPAAGERVYAIGDCSTFARPAIHNIFEAVPVLCANMCNDLIKAEGGVAREARVFKEDKSETQMVLLGTKKAVGAAKGWWLPGWLVRIIKRDYWLWTTEKLWNGRQWDKK